MVSYITVAVAMESLHRKFKNKILIKTSPKNLKTKYSKQLMNIKSYRGKRPLMYKGRPIQITRVICNYKIYICNSDSKSQKGVDIYAKYYKRLQMSI